MTASAHSDLQSAIVSAWERRAELSPGDHGRGP